MNIIYFLLYLLTGFNLLQTFSIFQSTTIYYFATATFLFYQYIYSLQEQPDSIRCETHLIESGGLAWIGIKIVF
ncbi:hypothetical protein MsAm2_06360 [Methanolapillus ohkumae]|uniref:Uncharacterized protein n=1 Tax=Methanolapillus ohkumae TaxID=3028298 RepID=A0AA96ZVH7_9EURY|nr:hypothetical protein MsAm2_06360 [Methanosarcinaceae archaeon Am2]